MLDPNHRKKGLGSSLVKAILNHPDLQGLKSWSLKTTEAAKKIYQNNGFNVIDNPDSQLEINDLEIYSRSTFVNL